MKSFLQWAEGKKYDLAFLDEQPDAQPATSESDAGKRAAVRAYAYPPQYGRGQYPKSYFRPIAADAATYQDAAKEQ